MRTSIGTLCESVETEEVRSNKQDETVFEVSVRQHSEYPQSTCVTLSRQAAIRLYHQLNNLLFAK